MSASIDLRAGRAARILQHYERMTIPGLDGQTMDQRELLEGLLGDLMRWADREGIVYSDASLTSSIDYSEELHGKESGER